jgi:hypothetical protein
VTTVVIPFFGGDPSRVRTLGLVAGFYRTAFPGWTVKVADGSSRGDAINQALPGCDQVVVLNDADSLPASPHALIEAVTMLMSDQDFVRPFTTYRKITKQQTEGCDDPFLILGDPQVEFDLGAASSHGISVTLRGVLEECGGYDPRFTGWGYEDLALDEILRANYTCGRVNAPLFHLWHELDPSGAAGSETLAANEALFRRYQDCGGYLPQLMALRAEAGELVAA